MGELKDKICASCDRAFWRDTLGVYVREEWFCNECFMNWVDSLSIEELVTEMGYEIGE